MLITINQDTSNRKSVEGILYEIQFSKFDK